MYNSVARGCAADMEGEGQGVARPTAQTGPWRRSAEHGARQGRERKGGGGTHTPHGPFKGQGGGVQGGWVGGVGPPKTP